MGTNPDDLNLKIEEAIQKALQTNQNSNIYYKKMNKHKKCSKCSTLITTEKYKEDRSVCKMCYITNTFILFKRRFFLLQENSSRKQDRLSNHVSNKENSSNKQDFSSNYLKDVDPDLLCDNLRETLEKLDRLERDNIMTKMIIDELLRAKAINKKQHDDIRKNVF